MTVKTRSRNFVTVYPGIHETLAVLFTLSHIVHEKTGEEFLQLKGWIEKDHHRTFDKLDELEEDFEPDLVKQLQAEMDVFVQKKILDQPRTSNRFGMQVNMEMLFFRRNGG